MKKFNEAKEILNRIERNGEAKKAIHGFIDGLRATDEEKKHFKFLVNVGFDKDDQDLQNRFDKL